MDEKFNPRTGPYDSMVYPCSYSHLCGKNRPILFSLKLFMSATINLGSGSYVENIAAWEVAFVIVIRLFLLTLILIQVRKFIKARFARITFLASSQLNYFS